MTKSIFRWSLYLAAALVLGPLAGQLVAQVEAADGSAQATAIIGRSIPHAWGMMLGAGAIAAASGVLGARLLGVRVGLTVSGLVMTWAAARSGSVEEILRIGAAPGVLPRLAFEGAIVGLLTTLLFMVMILVARPGPGGADDTLDGDDALIGAADLRSRVLSPAFAMSVGVAIVAGGVVVWLLAREGLKLQTIGAVTLGALVMGAAGRVADHRSPSVFIGLAITVLAIAGPLAAMFLHGSKVIDAAYAGELFPLARPAPLDWAAGALLGSRWGLDWASSLIERRSAHPAD